MVSVFRLPASLRQDEAQGQLALEELDGARLNTFGMGILSDGTPFLTQRGLAVLCGVENAHIGTISTQWQDDLPKPRISKIRDILAKNGHSLSEAHVPVQVGGRVLYAYREEISLAVIEYYAFEAGQFCQEEARDNFRILARKGFRDAIYETLGYTPSRQMDDLWKPFHDRVSLVYNSAPDGYFSIFKESAEVTVTLGQGGVYTDDGVIPDISIGKCWSKHWVDNRLADRFGQRLDYEHNYPAYFPQAASNPQTPWAYPEAALGEFKRWLREDYIRGGKLVAYIKGQVARKGITAAAANAALAAYKLPALPAPKRSAA
ncbi:hypothetical protein [Erythrobacter sp. WG]|uniref:hypothetical protein n=1 Tax=Erythrobacter sp. WG TaxID=2985510 RepID=UPI00226FA35D|nr:hypothetical protein [Erythrobacter sp. WG]MCX9148185.1 hypothetical protein [Erythrobacter sp. WG]